MSKTKRPWVVRVWPDNKPVVKRFQTEDEARSYYQYAKAADLSPLATYEDEEEVR